MNKLFEIIKKHRRINKYDLMDEARISISTYEKIKPWIEHKFPNFVKYDQKTKGWLWIVEEIKGTEDKSNVKKNEW